MKQYSQCIVLLGLYSIQHVYTCRKLSFEVANQHLLVIHLCFSDVVEVEC